MAEPHFKQIPKFKNLRGKTAHDGWYEVYDPSVKTDIAIHHSLTESGDSEAFANYHVNTLGWPEVAYHFVILTDGTVEWNHDLGVLSYHVGDSNYQSVGICVVGDFRNSEPTDAQKESLRNLHAALVKDLPNYKRTRGHNEFPGYSRKECPCFDYEAVLAADNASSGGSKAKPARLKTGTFATAAHLANAKRRLLSDYNWTVYEAADSTDFNPSYRLFTGTFTSERQAESYAKELRSKYGWTIYVVAE